MFSKSKRTLGLILAGLTVVSAFAACAPAGEGDTKGTTKAKEDEKPKVQSYSVDDVLGDAKIAMADEDNVKLKVWAPQAALKVFQKECDDFAAAMKKLDKTVEIEVVALGEADASSQLITDASVAADVLGFASDQGLNIFKAGLAAPVRQQFVQPIVDSNLKGSTDTIMFKGPDDAEELLYAYPSTGDNGYVLYYDKRVLKEEDAKTLEGILKVAEKEDKTFSMNMGNGYFGCMIPFTGGGTLAMEEDLETQKLNYDYDKIGPVAMAFAEKLTGCSKFISDDVDKTIVSGFKNGTYLGGVTGTWKAKDIEKALGENMGAIKLPTINVDGEDKQIITMFGYKNLAVNAQSKFPVTAQSLAYYLSSEECQKERFEEAGWGPSMTSLVESDEIQNDTVLKAIYAQQEFSVPQKDIVPVWWDPTGAFSGYCANPTEDHSEKEMKKQYDTMVQVIEAG